MRLLHATTHPKTRGLDYCTDLIDPHATTTNTAKISPHNQMTIVAGKEVAGEEVVAEGTLPTEGVTKTMGLTTIWGVITTLTARVVPATMGEILGTNPSRRHAPLRAIPVTW